MTLNLLSHYASVHGQSLLFSFSLQLTSRENPINFFTDTSLTKPFLAPINSSYQCLLSGSKPIHLHTA